MKTEKKYITEIKIKIKWLALFSLTLLTGIYFFTFYHSIITIIIIESVLLRSVSIFLALVYFKAFKSLIKLISNNPSFLLKIRTRIIEIIEEEVEEVNE